MPVNETAYEKPYVLGRLFAVLEHLQQFVHNSDNKSSYFDIVCETPARGFPVLDKLANHHLKRLSTASKSYF